jgi:homopolymeric O-antigen transport system ATP-binding protein
MCSNDQNKLEMLATESCISNRDIGSKDLLAPVSISVNNLSKCYQLYESPRDRLKQFVIPRIRRLFRLRSKQYFREFWALKNISFEIKKGTTVGIIGHNGSGKSTLLQIICGTLASSEGTVASNGRIAALLELGSGFNPEFTGRENVYMNGAIMGLSRSEIDDRFDDIVAFADIGDFIDQPVKIYSSGMFVRLAFATAVNVEPDILVVDEALAVGDSHFVQKCLRKFEQFQQIGITILYVTHDIISINKFCHKAILLDHGEIISNGKPKDVVDIYNAITAEKVSAEIKGESSAFCKTLHDLKKKKDKQRYGSGDMEISEVEILNSEGKAKNTFASLDETIIRIKAISIKSVENLIVGFSIRNRIGLDIYMINTKWQGINISIIRKDECLIVDFKQKMAMGEGEYFLNIAVSQETSKGIQRLDWIGDKLNFFIKPQLGKIHGGPCNLNSEISYKVDKFTHIGNEKSKNYQN